ncbi:hypothetical protein [Chlorobium sp. N1]|uniref:hypothetical protein n=1 Tax=Chlorobium sp. N1 TaxID=2491138 RepID=UPI00103B5FF5|nr:hypothetical protein [Chlorobium sp. N1]TCD48872.1 hypothetical protein E0L29_03025 [Chlorobium sp. N1]
MSRTSHNDMHAREEARKTMEILERMGGIEAHHLFRARLNERIERDSATGALGRTGAPRAANYRLAFMLLLILINLGSALVVLIQNAGDSTPAISEMLSSFGDDYSSSTFAYYQDQPVPDAPAETEAAPADLQAR